jgi:quercetin dioxygenase-like cupin family protein
MMPFYITDQMETITEDVMPHVDLKTAAGEFMKAAVLTKAENKGGSLHSHSDEEQWSYIIKGKMHFVLGDEEKILAAGDFVHIPRNVKHRSRAVDGPVIYFTVKSPVNAGGMRDDMTRIGGTESEAAEKKFEVAVKAKS